MSDNELKNTNALRMRVLALHHSCMASACFAKEDAIKASTMGDETEATAKRFEANAYECVVGWLRNADK